MGTLLFEGLEKQYFLLDKLSETTTKSIYKSMIENLRPAQIELDYPEREWDIVWKRLHSDVINPSGRGHLYLISRENEDIELITLK